MVTSKKLSEDKVNNTDDNLFTWNYTFQTGEEVVVSAQKLGIGKIPLGFLRRIRKLSDIDQTFELLERYVPEESLEILDLISEEDNKAYEAFLNAWFEDGGLDTKNITGS